MHKQRKLWNLLFFILFVNKILGHIIYCIVNYIFITYHHCTCIESSKDVTVNQYYLVVIYVTVNQYYEVVISKYVNLPDLIVLFYEFCFSDILPGYVEKGLL